MQSKTKKAFRNVLAFLTVLTMMLGMLPTTLLAANTDDSGTAGESGMHLSKTARLEDDGTYTINLEAYATGKTTTTITKEAVPLDIVLVLDQSGSMKDNMDSYTYTLENKNDYTYNDIGRYTRYYLDSDGNYYKVERGTAPLGEWWEVTNKCYYLYYEKDGIRYYLNGDKVDEEMPTKYKKSRTPIWNGQLYYRTTNTMKKLSALKDAVSNFVGVVNEKATTDKVNHRIAMVGFASESGYGDNTEILSVDGSNSDSVGVSYNSDEYADAIQNAFQNTSTVEGKTMLNNAINALAAEGATRADLGMKMAKDILDANDLKDDSKRKQLVIMFTDGTPTSDNTFDSTVADDAIKTSKSLKDRKTTVYTVGIFDGADPTSTSTNENQYMNYVSSNYPSAENLKTPGKGSNGGYYLATSSANGLNKIFTSISNKITTPSTTVTLNSAAVMKDILSDDFTLPEGYNAEDKISISTVPGSITDGEPITWGEVESSPTGVVAAKEQEDNIFDITGFDYSQEFIAPGHDGKKLVVTIKGVIPKDSAVTGEKVYTNNEASGIYAEGATEPAAKFPQPQVVLTNKAYVLDYAKPVTLSPLDWKMSSDNMAITKSIGEKAAGYTPEYGLLDNTSLVYSPKTTNWDGYDKFYAFGKTTDNNTENINGNKNLWSRVSVLPANNVYYEDDFEANNETGKVGIEYTGKWTTDTSDAGSANTGSVDKEIHGGWKENTALADDTEYSGGSAHVADADVKDEEGKAAIATFTFSGTGVDIYSRTNNEVGKVSAILSSITTDGKKVVRAVSMDNKSASGDYYQIPTLSFGPLDYGKYEVKLVVVAAGKKGTDNRRGIYYLDGIRVYNPIQNKENDKVVSEAYGIDMLNATFKEVRDILLDTNTTETEFTNGAAVFLDRTTDAEGVTSSSVAAFKDYGPKNEVYLATGQKIAFEVTNPNASYYVGLKAPAGKTTVRLTNDKNVSPTEIGHSTDLYYKITPVSEGEYAGCIVIENTGDNLLAITKIYYNNELGGIEGISDTESAQTVTYSATSADAFDDGSQFTDASDGDMPEAENTDLFAAEAEEVPEAEESVSVLDNPLVLKLVEYANVFDTLSEVPYEDKTVEETPDSSQNENTEVTEPDDGNVDITNPEPNEDQKPIDKIHSWLNKLFQGFNGWL